MSIILKAIEVAINKHKDQTRKVSGAPYVTHPLAVSYLAAKYKTSKHLEEIIAAAILHDVLEDTETTFGELAAVFPPLVVSLVQELTSDEAEIARVGKNVYLKKKLCGISSYGLVLKLVDRLHNVLDHPALNYRLDTLDLIQYLRKHRKLTRTQKEICNEIQDRCVFPID